MSKSPKADFKKLKDEWYEKLKTTKSKEYPNGFQDIEKDEDTLKKYSFQSVFDNTKNKDWQAKATYYQMATNFLEDYKFSTTIEKLIWEYHANGISLRDISKLLTKAKVTSIFVNKDAIFAIVQKLKKSMYSMYLNQQDEYHE